MKDYVKLFSGKHMNRQPNLNNQGTEGHTQLTIILIVVFLAINCALGFWFALPYLVLNQIKDAAIKGDVNKLVSLVDVDAVRASVQPALGSTDIVDLAVSTSGIANLLATSNIVSGDSLAGSSAAVDASTGCQPVCITPEVEPNTIHKSGWETLDTFVATSSQKYMGQGVTFILKRKGLMDWKLVKIEFQASPVVHTPVYFVGFLSDPKPNGIKDVLPFDRLLAVNENAVVDYPSAVGLFKAAGDAADLAVLRDGKLVKYKVSKAPRGKFGFVLSGYVCSPRPEVVSTPAALEPATLLKLMSRQDPALAASLVQQGQLVLLSPQTQVLKGEDKEIPLGRNQAVTLMQARVLEGSVVAGASGAPGRNYWVLSTNFPPVPTEAK
jgi:hypothetical protein